MYKIYKIGHIIEVYTGKSKTTKKEESPEVKKINQEYKEIMALFQKEKEPLPEDIQDEIRQYNRQYYRTQKNIEIRRMILTNFSNKSYFSTLTFSPQIEEIKEGNEKINRYTMLLRKKDPNIKYIFIPERHESGYIHYHGFIDGNISFKEANKKWKYGVCINKIIDHVDNIGAYIISYITKTTEDSPRKQKVILQSRNLYRPEPEYSEELPSETLGKAPVFTKEWKDFEGRKITYIQYNLKRK